MWLGVVLCVALPADSWVGKSSEQIQPALSELHQKQPHFLERFLAISKHFLGAPYKFSPLGEGEGATPDPDPVFVTSEFDCLSLVEISLALASSPQIESAFSNLLKLRYHDGQKHYTLRKHFMESQWIPENIAAGWIKDITKQVAPDESVLVQKTLNPAVWAKRKKLEDLELPPETIPNGTYKWWTVPLDKMMEVAPRIPHGAIVFVVREDYQSIPYRITHVGIVLQKKSGTYLRHAKDQGAHRVLDMPLETVVSRHSEFVKWPVTGFSIYMPVRPDHS